MLLGKEDEVFLLLFFMLFSACSVVLSLVRSVVGAYLYF